MIQDIAPHRLDRTYVIGKPDSADIALCVRRGRGSSSRGDGVRNHGEVRIDFIHKLIYLEYLFSITIKVYSKHKSLTVIIAATVFLP